VKNEEQPAEAQRSPRWQQLREEAKNDPEHLRQLHAAEHVMENFRDTLRKLAKS